ncbi:pacifastin-like protease inhibitor cvp4 [Schistocerca americana]|uniref:pacifastin-like protease inhibitor cvp4 n=1 Tax=Schistocerca americana TaxID=7009 RepID=UPI001F4F2C8E|nr:pacifastin-like protease inhibitor cvp4 [Schistocerca americana]
MRSRWCGPPTPHCSVVEKAASIPTQTDVDRLPKYLAPSLSFDLAAIRFYRGVRGHNQATQCVPGTSFMLSCNRCICRRSGRSAICTKFNCLERAQEVCAPGSSKSFDCNICICSSQEKWVCTQKQCRSEQGEDDCETESKEISRAPNQPCRPGMSFRSGCSRCYCSPDGMSVVCRSQPCHGVSGTLLPLQSNCGDKDGCRDNTRDDSHGEKGEGGGGGGGGQKEKSACCA